MAYGFKVKDGVNENLMTASTGTIISCGTVSMPNALNGDRTYGLDIDLPGTDAIDISKISVIVTPHNNIHFTSWTCWRWLRNYPANTSTWFTPCSMLDDYYSYYTRNDSTGVMTPYTAGSRTPFNISTWDLISAVFPSSGWDRFSSTITKVRLWAATTYLIVSGISTYKTIYSIGNTGGIELVDYVIFLKEWDY